MTEISARVNLQSLLDHTARRIIQTISPFSFEKETLVLFSKWGCDGSTGQQQYKQLFTGEQHSDSDIFLTSCVPLLLYEEQEDDPNMRRVYW